MNVHKRKKLARIAEMKQKAELENLPASAPIEEQKEVEKIEDKKELAEEPVVATSSILKKKKVVNEPA